MTTNVIALDGDGVLFNYNKGVAHLYKEVFCKDVKVKLKGAYHAHNEYDLEADGDISQKFKDHFISLFDKRDMWSRLPAIEGAKEAIDIMISKGYEVVCLTSMPPKFEQHRLQNAKLHDMGISKVIAVDRKTAKEKGISNPKKEYLKRYEPYAFVDDLMKNFTDLSEIKENRSTNLVYLDNKYPDNPNESFSMDLVHEVVDSLLDFANALPVYKEVEDLNVESKKKIKA